MSQDTVVFLSLSLTLTDEWEGLLSPNPAALPLLRRLHDGRLRTNGRSGPSLGGNPAGLGPMTPPALHFTSLACRAR